MNPLFCGVCVSPCLLLLISNRFFVLFVRERNCFSGVSFVFFYCIVVICASLYCWSRKILASFFSKIDPCSVVSKVCK